MADRIAISIRSGARRGVYETAVSAARVDVLRIDADRHRGSDMNNLMPPMRPVKPKSNSFVPTLIVVILVMLVIAAVIGNASSASAPSGPAFVPGKQFNGITATYKLGGSACSVSITYENENGQTEQQDKVSTSWTKSFVVQSGQYLYISAQNNCDGGSVTCEIDLNGSPTSAASKSSGAYVIATCSGHVP